MFCYREVCLPVCLHHLLRIARHHLVRTDQVEEAVSLQSQFDAAFVPDDLAELLFTGFRNLGQSHCHIRRMHRSAGSGAHHFQLVECFPAFAQFIAGLGIHQQYIGITQEDQVTILFGKRVLVPVTGRPDGLFVGTGRHFFLEMNLALSL